MNYNPNQALDPDSLDPDSWDGNFHTVSLHSFMKYLALDVLNIKESLFKMQKYILGKTIENNSVNDINNFKNMGKSLWEFISTIYNSHWDNLFVDNNQMTFRSKVKSKFNSQVNKPKISVKDKEMVKPTFVFALLPSILAKSQKKVNEILKFFKKTNSSTLTKSYAQASTISKKTTSSISLLNITRDILKIKEMFPNLSNKKIDLVQKVINGSINKPKPRINITTKGPSCKQVIMLMNSKLSKKFIKDLNLHVTNINCALKGIASKTIVNFIRVEDKGIVVTTNNISSNSDLQEIKNYVKSSLSFDME